MKKNYILKFYYLRKLNKKSDFLKSTFPEVNHDPAKCYGSETLFII